MNRALFCMLLLHTMGMATTIKVINSTPYNIIINASTLSNISYFFERKLKPQESIEIPLLEQTVFEYKINNPKIPWEWMVVNPYCKKILLVEAKKRRIIALQITKSKYNTFAKNKKSLKKKQTANYIPVVNKTKSSLLATVYFCLTDQSRTYTLAKSLLEPSQQFNILKNIPSKRLWIHVFELGTSQPAKAEKDIEPWCTKIMIIRSEGKLKIIRLGSPKKLTTDKIN